ncbi:MAG: PHP domain-containing protein [Syntrophobacteraceae bacterium]
MRIDLHCHSKFSHDNYLEPQHVIDQAVKMGLEGVCFAEHYSNRKSWGMGRLQFPEGFIIFSGEEIATDKGHMLVYGLRDDSWNIWESSMYLPALEVIEAAHRQGGICVPAHPFRGCDSFGEEVFKIEGIDAIETHNGMNREEQNLPAIRAALTRGLPSIGGSDCHKKEQVGRGFTVFKNPVKTIDDMIDQIRKGNCQGAVL